MLKRWGTPPADPFPFPDSTPMGSTHFRTAGEELIGVIAAAPAEVACCGCDAGGRSEVTGGGRPALVAIAGDCGVVAIEAG
jgi:hypothetical protein